MSFQVNAPPSVVAKLVKSEMSVEGEPKKQSREDWKKMKELEEMRKAGTAPAMQDEEGKDINPHIPQYIMQAPWYFGANAPTLRHQRPQEEFDREFAKIGEWYKRGVKEGPVATKYRKGACGNCGAMTHKKKDCMERPRKVGAKFTGDQIAPDEYMQVCLSHDYDGKRDRWNGADLEEHQQKLFSEYEKVEEAKRTLKEQKLDESIMNDKEGGSDNEDKYAEEMDMPGQKFETKQRITVRNLRIREDTAKYLYNLDPNSAYYDPKTRSMRENPFQANLGKDGVNTLYGGDNFVRGSGDAHDMAKQQMFAWDAFERGTDVHLQADPTKLELLHKEYNYRKEDYKQSAKDSIISKYGGQEHLEAPPKQLLLAQTEDYVEYSRHGTVIKGMERSKVKSRYEEDIYINNHMSIWGSFWQAGRWGFKCCHSFIKESYCTGEAGKAAQEVGGLIPIDNGEIEEPPKSLVEEHQEKIKKKKNKKKEKKKKKKKKHKKRHSSSDSSSESESEDDEQRLKKALEREEENKKRADRLLGMDERKRPYNSMYDVKAPTEDEVEAWRMKRQREEDPMAAFLS